jgi:hypothetical protein
MTSGASRGLTTMTTGQVIAAVAVSLDGLTPGAAVMEVAGVVDAPGVTHLTYRIRT